MLLHLSISATDPENAARFIAMITGGTALPFPPCPGAWVSFGPEDDSTAIEVYPADRRAEAGPDAITFSQHAADASPTATHIALTSPLDADTLITHGTEAGWLTRLCNRGPFNCVEVWIENRVLIEVLDPEMTKQYHSGMTIENWRAMFAMESGDE